MDINLIIVAVYSYILGSIPFGLILTKIFLKKDIRKIGSGNIGATNALRTGNKIIGYSTFIFDVLKAVIPVLYVKINFPDAIYISALCAFIGHVFPVWLKFNHIGKICPTKHISADKKIKSLKRFKEIITEA